MEKEENVNVVIFTSSQDEWPRQLSSIYILKLKYLGKGLWGCGLNMTAESRVE